MTAGACETGTDNVPEEAIGIETKAASQTSSLKTRYVTKVISNVLVLVANVVMQSVIPRALGPVAYGNFNFVTNFFQQFIGFLNLNTSTTFYTKLSQRQEDSGLVSFYLKLLMGMGGIMALFVVGVAVVGNRQVVWPDQEFPFILLGALWAFLSFCFSVFCEMTDAYGLTVKSEMAKLALKLFALTLILVMFWLKVIDLPNFFAYQLILLLISIVVVLRIMDKGGHPLPLFAALRREQWQEYSSEFVKFCLPLVVFTGASTFQGILERWFLQKYAGSEQQGFYGLALQIGSICFLFSSAMIPLLAREYSISSSKNDLKEMKRLFLRFVPMLYAITAYFGCFLTVEAKEVMLLFGGKGYTGAVLPIAIMCLYPLHQTYGQMNASLFFATGRTVAYRNIGILMILVSLPLTFFLVGPANYGALQGGATGLAVKMVAIQLLSTNLQLLYLARLLQLPFWRLFGHQLVTALLFLAAACSASYGVSQLLPGAGALEKFLLSGIVYSIGIALLVVSVPSLAALKREEILRILPFAGSGRRSE